MFRLNSLFPLALALALLLGWQALGSLGAESNSAFAAEQSTLTLQNSHTKDLKWFKEQMGISPQYQEASTGVLGMSWPHFFVMVFLVVFFFVALIAVYVRNRRTRQILIELVKEKSHEPQG